MSCLLVERTALPDFKVKPTQHSLPTAHKSLLPDGILARYPLDFGFVFGFVFPTFPRQLDRNWVRFVILSY
jgi:hypothetical protein